MRYAVILAGGSGTRLWPLSRQGMPKQLLELFDGKSLLRLAYERIATLVDPSRILVCTSRAYLDVVAAQLPELARENLLGEPVGRDSLGAVAWSTAVVAHRDPEAVVAMLSADHLISPVADFQQALVRAYEAAEAQADALVTMGVVPTEPHTGYGYLQRAAELPGAPGVWRVAQFHEKPGQELAEQYLASGRYWWNSGLFVWRAKTLLDQLDQLHPEVASRVRRIAASPELLDELFPGLTKTSIDYAVMQPVSHGATPAQVLAVALPISWADVGSFVALAESFSSDDQGNRVLGRTITLNSEGCILINAAGDGHLLAGLGLRATLLVHTPKATLAASLAEVSAVRELVEMVRQLHGQEFA